MIKVGDLLLVPGTNRKTQVIKLVFSKGSTIATVFGLSQERIKIDVSNCRPSDLGDFWFV
jgi:hypothetical protein